MSELEYRRAYMAVMIYGIQSRYGTFVAKRIIKDHGGVEKLRDVPDDKVEAVIADCGACIRSLGDTPGPRQMAQKLVQKRA